MLPGFTVSRPAGFDPQGIEHVMLRRPLSRVLAFTGRSIDDVINCPIVKREVLGYWKVQKQVERATALRSLEDQWNPLGRRL